MVSNSNLGVSSESSVGAITTVATCGFAVTVTSRGQQDIGLPGTCFRSDGLTGPLWWEWQGISAIEE